MGALNHIPPLAIEPQQPVNPLDQYGKLQNIAALAQQHQQQQALMPGQLEQQRQQIQAAALENQQKTRQAAQGQALDKAFQMALTPDPVSGKPTFDSGKVLDSVTASGNGSLVPQLTETFNTLDQKKATLEKTKQETATAMQDYAGSLAAEVKQAGYTPGAAGIALAHLSQVDPQTATALKNQFQQNPDSIKQWTDQAIAGSPKQREVAAQEMAAQARMNQAGKQSPGDEPLPNVDQYNQALAQRYQVLNPGKPLPPPFTLPPNATQKDFDRVDKLLQGTEQAAATKAQRDAVPPGTSTLVENGKNPDGSPHMSLLNTKTGVLSEPQGPGGSTIQAKGTSAPTQAMKTSAYRANTALAGIPDVINDVDRMKDKLGPVMGRWNDFLQGKVGGNDPDFAGLRADMTMLSTAVTLAHAQGRMSDSLKEDFSAMLNQPKQTPENIKAILGKVQTWMQRQANVNAPNAARPQTSGAPSNSGQAGTSGRAVSLAAAKQLPAMAGKTDDEIKALIQAQGHTVAP
jgi:hypothetical protein